jgi:hypothetical protein
VTEILILKIKRYELNQGEKLLRNLQLGVEQIFTSSIVVCVQVSKSYKRLLYYHRYKSHRSHLQAAVLQKNTTSSRNQRVVDIK